MREEIFPTMISLFLPAVEYARILKSTGRRPVTLILEYNHTTIREESFPHGSHFFFLARCSWHTMSREGHPAYIAPKIPPTDKPNERSTIALALRADEAVQRSRYVDQASEDASSQD